MTCRKLFAPCCYCLIDRSRAGRPRRRPGQRRQEQAHRDARSVRESRPCRTGGSAGKGFFAAQNLEVELQTPIDPNDPSKLVATNKADLAVSSQPQLHIHVNAGLPLKRIGTLVATPLNALVVLQRVRSKPWPTSRAASSAIRQRDSRKHCSRPLLAQTNLQPEEVTLVDVGASPSSALLSGQVDAAIGVFRNVILNQMDFGQKPGRIFYPEEEVSLPTTNGCWWPRATGSTILGCGVF